MQGSGVTLINSGGTLVLPGGMITLAGRTLTNSGLVEWDGSAFTFSSGTLNNKGGFPERVSKYLGKKYGYNPEAGANSGSRVADVALEDISEVFPWEGKCSGRHFIKHGAQRE